MVTITPMTDEALVDWAPRLWRDYHADLIRAGYSQTSADDNVARNRDSTMPEGRLAPGQYVFDIRSEGSIVGNAWLAESNSEWFVYNLEIIESARGRGLGREALIAIEDFVRSRGGTVLSLSVFGFNEVAQRLYVSQGFATVQMSMTKWLD